MLWGVNDSLMWELLNGNKRGSDASKVLAGAIMKGTSGGLTLVMALQASGAKHELGEVLGQSGYSFSTPLCLSLTLLLLILSVVGYSKIEEVMEWSERVGRRVSKKILVLGSLASCIAILVVGMGVIPSILLVGVGVGMKATSNTNVSLLVIASLPVFGMVGI